MEESDLCVIFIITTEAALLMVLAVSCGHEILLTCNRIRARMQLKVQAGTIQSYSEFGGIHDAWDRVRGASTIFISMYLV